MCFLWIFCFNLPSFDVNPLDLQKATRYEILASSQHSLFYLGSDKYTINLKVNTELEGDNLMKQATSEWKQWTGCSDFTQTPVIHYGPLEKEPHYQSVSTLTCNEY